MGQMLKEGPRSGAGEGVLVSPASHVVVGMVSRGGDEPEQSPFVQKAGEKLLPCTALHQEGRSSPSWPASRAVAPSPAPCGTDPFSHAGRRDTLLVVSNSPCLLSFCVLPSFCEFSFPCLPFPSPHPPPCFLLIFLFHRFFFWCSVSCDTLAPRGCACRLLSTSSAPKLSLRLPLDAPLRASPSALVLYQLFGTEVAVWVGLACVGLRAQFLQLCFLVQLCRGVALVFGVFRASAPPSLSVLSVPAALPASPFLKPNAGCLAQQK